MGAHRTNPTAQAVARGEAVCVDCGMPLGVPRGDLEWCAPCQHGRTQRKPARRPSPAVRTILMVAAMLGR